MPFRKLTDLFTGANDVRRMGRQAKEAARAQYDPSVLSPQLSMFRELATEGIEDEAAIARTGAIGQLFRDVDTSLAGGNQGRALAMQQQQNQAATQGLADFERGLAQADIQARREGQQGFAQTQTQQNQIRAQREAAIETADLQTQAEIDRRKGALGATVGNLAGTIAGSFLGPVGAGVAGGLGGAIFGGGQGALTGAATGATTAMQFGTEETEGTDVGQMLTDQARASVDTTSVDDSPITPEGLNLEDFDLGSFLQMDFADNPEAQTEQSIQRNVMGDMGAEYQVPRFLAPTTPADRIFSGLEQQAQSAAMGLQDEQEIPEGGLLFDYLRQQTQGDVDQSLLGERVTGGFAESGQVLGPIGEYTTQFASRAPRQLLNLYDLFYRGATAPNVTGQ